MPEWGLHSAIRPEQSKPVLPSLLFRRMPLLSCFRNSHRACIAVVSFILALGVLQCGALSIEGVPDHIWNHVLNVEPNRNLQQLGEISEAPDALTRTYLSSAHKQAAQQIQQWMESAGMTAYIDVLGNVHGIVEGTEPELGELVVGSHYDTVVDGGKYDGALGVLLGISAVKAVLLQALHKSGRLSDLEAAITEQITAGSDVQLPAEAVKGLLRGGVHVIGFCDEEGIRFRSTFLGSRAMSGALIKHKQLEVQDSSGLTLEDVLKDSGVANPTEAIQALALDPAKVRHYVEFHMEQGPQLEAAGLALGVVSGIAGQTWLSVNIEGVQGHAGSVPMDLRKDPMAAAAAAIHAIEATCTGTHDDSGGLDVSGEALVCTVGRIHAHPNQVNIIPNWVIFTVDIRCKRQEFRHKVISQVEAEIQEVCNKRGVNCTIARTHDAPPVHSDAGLLAQLQAAVLQAQTMIQRLVPDSTLSSPDQCDSSSSNDQDSSCRITSSEQSSEACDSSSSSQGSSCSNTRTNQSSQACNSQDSSCSSRPFSAAQFEVPVLLSGAGHDAMAMADITKIGMVFVRCAGGVSHSPREHVDPRDVAAATAAFATFMEMDLLEQPTDTSDRVEL